MHHWKPWLVPLDHWTDEEKFQIKETGKIAPQEHGSLEYLGRQIIRFEDNGPLTLGLPETYFDSVEATLEMNLKPVQSPPKLERFADVKEDMELSEKEAKVFRAALGRLAWIAVSLPPIQFQTNFVACFQAKPTQSGMAALKDAVRHMKKYRFRLSVSLFVCLFAWLAAWLFVFVFVFYLPVCFAACLSVCLASQLSAVCLSVFLPRCLCCQCALWGVWNSRSRAGVPQEKRTPA